MFLPATAVMSLMGLIRGGPGDTGERRGDGGSEPRKRDERDGDGAVDGVRGGQGGGREQPQKWEVMG